MRRHMRMYPASCFTSSGRRMSVICSHAHPCECMHAHVTACTCMGGACSHMSVHPQPDDWCRSSRPANRSCFSRAFSRCTHCALVGRSSGFSAQHSCTAHAPPHFGCNNCTGHPRWHVPIPVPCQVHVWLGTQVQGLGKHSCYRAFMYLSVVVTEQHHDGG